jgi:diguanylate cyclase
VNLFQRKSFVLGLIPAYTAVLYVCSYYLLDYPRLLLLLETFSAALSWIILHRVSRRHEGILRRFWFLVSLGSFCYLAALLIWLRYVWILRSPAPAPSLADFFWLMEAVLLIYALYYLVGKQTCKTRGLRIIIDNILVMILAGTLSWEYVIHPNMLQSWNRGSWLLIATNALYPVSDLAILFSMLFVYFAYRELMPFKVHLLLSLGLLLFVFADTMYFILTAKGQYFEGSWIDPLYSMALLLQAAAGLYSFEDSPIKRVATTANNRRIHYSLIAPYLVLAAFLAITIVPGRIDMSDGVILGAIAAVVFMFIRQTLLLLENKRLMGSMQEMLAESRYLANHDTLTGLPNRRYFEQRLKQELSKPGGSCAVFMFDLDRFKNMNDSYGHASGDQLIRFISERLSEVVDERHFASRQGGDEFTVLLADLKTPSEACEFAERLLSTVTQPFRFGGLELTTTTSIGIALYPEHGTTVTNLLKHADIAMYRAKASGGNRS